MLATLEKIDDLKTYDIDHKTNGNKQEAYELDIPEQAQVSLDKILQYYECSCMKPVVKAQGTPLDITSTLVKEVKQSLPNNLQGDAKNILDFMIQEIVNYCREQSANSLSINFTFERSGMGKA